MTYGLKVVGPNGKTLINPGISGGSIYRDIQTISISSGTQVVDYTDVPGGAYLKVLQVIPGTHNYTISTYGGYARVTFNYYNSASSGAVYNSTYLIFSSYITEPDYGLKVINDAGEKLISTIYRTPAFLGKMSQTFSGAYSMAASDGYVIDEVQTSVSIGYGKNRLLMYAMPDSSSVYFCGLPYFPPSYSNLRNYMVRPSGSSIVSPPDVYIFDLDTVVDGTGSGSYGLKVYNASSQVTYDSNKSHLSLSAIQTIAPGTPASPSLYTISSISGIDPLIFCPTNGGNKYSDSPVGTALVPDGLGGSFTVPTYAVYTVYTGYRKNGTQFAVADFLQDNGYVADGFSIMFSPVFGQATNLFTYYADSYGY